MKLIDFENYLIDKINSLSNKSITNTVNVNEKAELDFLWEVLEEVNNFKMEDKDKWIGN